MSEIRDIYATPEKGEEIDRRFWELALAVAESAVKCQLITLEEADGELGYAWHYDDTRGLEAVASRLGEMSGGRHVAVERDMRAA